VDFGLGVRVKESGDKFYHTDFWLEILFFMDGIKCVVLTGCIERK
jgi:hypothetical protein